MGTKQALYTGLDPRRFCYEGLITHIPFITTIAYRHPQVEAAFKQLDAYSDVLLTSRSAVDYFFDWTRKTHYRFYAVGAATADKLQERGVTPFVASKQTAEGVCELLDKHPPQRLFYPHAKAARKVIAQWLCKNKIEHLAVAFYETCYLSLDPLPDLSLFDEIIFTSPSTIKAFLHNFGTLPSDKKLTAIGPVTALELQHIKQCALTSDLLVRAPHER